MDDYQYQHFVSKFLLKKFKDVGLPIYKCKNNIWMEHNPLRTGGEDCFYGFKDNSLEVFFGNLENSIAAMFLHSHLDKKDEAYLKIFILLMAYRSPSKNQIITEKYENFINGIKNQFSEKEICSIFEKRRNEQDNWLASLDDDFEMRKIINEFPNSFSDSDNSKFYPIITQELLQILPKFGKCFEIQIFESDADLIIGETPTLSINLDINEVKITGEEAGLIHKNVMYWLPVAYNKVAFMYNPSNIVAIKCRKLRKEDTIVLNYYQKEKSPFFYSRIKDISFPDLPTNFNWTQHFNYVFEYSS